MVTNRYIFIILTFKSELSLKKDKVVTTGKSTPVTGNFLIFDLLFIQKQ